jgi:hypothetical protein
MPGPTVATEQLADLDKTIARVEQSLQRLSSDRPRLVLVDHLAKGLVSGALTLVINDEPLPVDTPLLLTDMDEALGLVTLRKARPMSIPEFRECEDAHGIPDYLRKKQWPSRRRLYKHEVAELQPWSRPQLIKLAFDVPEPRYTAQVHKDTLADDVDAPPVLAKALAALDGIDDALQPAANRMVDLLQLRGDARANLSRIGEVLKAAHRSLVEATQGLELPDTDSPETVDPFARVADAIEAVQKALEQLPTRTEVASRLQDSLEHLQAFAELEGVEHARPMSALALADIVREMDAVDMLNPVEVRKAMQCLLDLVGGPLVRYEQIHGVTMDKAKEQYDLLEAAAKELGCKQPPLPHDFDDGLPRPGAVHLLCRDERMSLMLSHDLGNGCCANYAIKVQPPIGCTVPRTLKEAVLMAKSQRLSLLSQLLDTPEANLYSCELADDYIDVDKARFEPGEMLAFHSEGPALLVKMAKPTITLGYSDEDQQELFLEKDAYLVGRLVFDHKLAKAKWSAKYINALPDSAFLYVEPGGKKGKDGRTFPPNKRHFPVRDKNGKLDAPHIRNALSSIDQSDAKGLTAAKKKKLKGEALKLLREASKKSEGSQVDQATLHSDLTPHILSAVGATPAGGRPCLPAALTKDFMDPFWEEEDPAEALNKLLKARSEMTQVLAPGALQIVDGAVCQVVVKYYVEGEQVEGKDTSSPPHQAFEPEAESTSCQVEKKAPRYPIKKRAGRLQVLKQETRSVEGEEERYILGVVLIPNEPDSHGDIYSAKDVRDAAHFFMECSQTLGLEHERALARNKVFVLESYLTPCACNINGQSIPEGTWMLAARVVDDDLWDDIKKGKITGWSIEGSAIAIDIV